jgi:transposase
MRGRQPAGLDYVDRLRHYDAETKRRAKVILQTMFDGLRLLEACAILGVCAQRFHQLREAFIREGLEGIKPRPKGRPPRRASPQEQELQQLRQELADARIELRAAQARAEIATVLPRVLQTPPTPPAAPPVEEKKTPPRRRR